MTKEAGTDQMGGLEMINEPGNGRPAPTLSSWQKPRSRRRKNSKTGLTPVTTASRGQIKKIVAAQFIDQLLTETGNKDVDWPALCQRVTDHLLATQADGLEQGYWVDMNNVDSVTRASTSIAGLQPALPEDIRDNLNWLPEKPSSSSASSTTLRMPQRQKRNITPHYTTMTMKPPQIPGTTIRGDGSGLSRTR